MRDPEDTVSIENVVASTAFDQELDLETLAGDLPQAEFDPARFAGLIYRTDDPPATTMIFRSGRVVITGAKSIADAHEALEIVFNEYEDLGVLLPTDPDISVVNIVSTADLGVALNLNTIAIGLGLEQIEYEPEQFPGLVYRLDEPPVVVLLFGSGKVVIAGGTSPEQTLDALDVVGNRLTELGVLN